MGGRARARAPAPAHRRCGRARRPRHRRDRSRRAAGRGNDPADGGASRRPGSGRTTSPSGRRSAGYCPGPMLRLPEAAYLALVGHALDGYPLEACGLLIGLDERVDAFYPCRNAAESSKVYEIDPRDHLRADRAAEDDGRRAHRRRAQPHPHRRVPVTDRRRAGARSRLGTTPSCRCEKPSPSCARTGSSTASSPRSRWWSSGGRPVPFPTDRLGIPMPAYDSVLDLIGNTPLVDVSALSPNPRARMFAKLEEPEPGRLGQGPAPRSG